MGDASEGPGDGRDQEGRTDMGGTVTRGQIWQPTVTETCQHHQVTARLSNHEKELRQYDYSPLKVNRRTQELELKCRDHRKRMYTRSLMKVYFCKHF